MEGGYVPELRGEEGVENRVNTGVGVSQHVRTDLKKKKITINQTVDYMARAFMILMRGKDITQAIGRDWLKVERPDPNRLLLRCRVNGINHTWVPHLRAVYSDFGISINTPPPADNLIAELTLGWETLHITNIIQFLNRYDF